MSYISGDRFDEPFFVDQDFEPHKCERCAKSLSVEGRDFCLACAAIEDAEEAAAQLTEFAKIPLITQRPVPGPSFAEIKRVIDKMENAEDGPGCEYCGAIYEVNPKCPACAGIERYES